MTISKSHDMREVEPGLPLVTMAIFAFNNEAHIREAVHGALSQTYRPLEIILSDDCSTDRTYEIIRDVASRFEGPHSVRLNRNDRNLGLVAHVNKVVGMAAGEIFVLAAGDDIALPTRVRDSVEAFRRHKSVAMVSFVDEVIDDMGNAVWNTEASCRETTFTLEEFIQRGPLAQRELKLSGASRAIRKSAFQTFGDMLPECPAEDTPLILRALYVGEGLVCHWPGIRYRQHGAQLSAERSIARMDASYFRKQYLSDLVTARECGLIQGAGARRVKRWIIERDLFVRLRQLEFQGDRPPLTMLPRVLLSSNMSAREKLGACKRYLMRGPVGARLRRWKAHLHDLFVSPRDYLHHLSRSKSQSDLASWSSASIRQSDTDARSGLIARHIRPGDQIAEFGAGVQALRVSLPEGCAYYPFDLVARTTDTTVCDLNKGFPSIPEPANVAAFSGVIEYLDDVPGTFRWLSEHFERVIFSYAVSDRVPSPLLRRRNGWVNDLSRHELIGLVRAQGFSCQVVDTWRNHLIFLAEKP